MKQMSKTRIHNRKIDGWKMASLIHCLVFSWQYGLILTYVFRFGFGIAEPIMPFSFPYASIFVQTFKEAPYWLYGSAICLLCLHTGKLHLKTNSVVLCWIVMLAFTHQAMLANRTIILFYFPCIIFAILPFLNRELVKKTRLFDWPLCQNETKYPFNKGVLVMTLIVLALIFLVLSIPEILKIPVLPIVTIGFKIIFLEDLRRHYEIVYENCLGKTN